MDVRGIVNLVCGIAGALVVLFGILVLASVIPGVVSSRGMAPVFLGGIILLWSLISGRRRR